MTENTAPENFATLTVRDLKQVTEAEVKAGREPVFHVQLQGQHDVFFRFDTEEEAEIFVEWAFAELRKCRCAGVISEDQLAAYRTAYHGQTLHEIIL